MPWRNPDDSMITDAWALKGRWPARYGCQDAWHRGKPQQTSEQRRQQLVLVQNLRQLIEKRRQSLRVRFLSNRPAQFTHTDDEAGFHFYFPRVARDLTFIIVGTPQPREQLLSE